jgi:vacuolar-type H+-ATPase subunit C/Vma6
MIDEVEGTHMVNLAVHDLDYLVARLHGRYGRMAAGERLSALCRNRSVTELAREVFPGETVAIARQFQRRIVEELCLEAAELREHLGGPEARLLDAMLLRLTMEELKVLLRGVLTGTAPGTVRDYLILSPHMVSLDLSGLAAAKSLTEFNTRLPEGALRDELTAALSRYRDQTEPFLFEAALDRAYLRQLLEQAQQLAADDRALVYPLVRQEADIFHLMLVARGRFFNGLPAELLAPLHVPATAISKFKFAAMLRERDLGAAVRLVTGGVLDGVPTAVSDAEAIESLAWRHIERLALRTFRGRHLGFGAVAAYVVLRRLEAANLITISEGIRLGLSAETIRENLIPRQK